MIDDEVYINDQINLITEGDAYTLGFNRNVGFNFIGRIEMDKLMPLKVVTNDEGLTTKYLSDANTSIPQMLGGDNESHEYIFDYENKKFYYDDTSYDLDLTFGDTNALGEFVSVILYATPDIV